jgi:CDP-4-dehydro-6-deoxyglucose reductase
MNATIVENRQYTPSLWQLSLQLDTPITFEPGQYISFELKEHGTIFRRPYSLLLPSSGETTQLTLLVKRDGHFSNVLCDAQPGTTYKILGPYGRFLYERADKTVFVATGVGLAPLYCMLQAHRPKRTWLFFGVRNENELLFHTQLGKLGITYVPVLSKPETNWNGERGHVQDSLILHWSDVKDATFYVCGGKESVRDVRAFLRERTVPEERIKYEAF